uniref:Uncharacterized protein n=1 Tax=Leersia perrieri TaxID=77586 RepID=A0A0D9XXB7_9ORYZ
MDAISFALGVRFVHLPDAQLRNIIYALDDHGKEANRHRASGRLVYHLAEIFNPARGSPYQFMADDHLHDNDMTGLAWITLLVGNS